jgi:RND family efflux transporter MFP subunit
MKHTPHPNHTTRRRFVRWEFFIILMIAWSVTAQAKGRRQDSFVEGFTDPYRTVDVAAPDSGIVDEIHVTEGTHVKVGQLLAALDRELYETQLAIAQEAASAKGRLESAQQELKLRTERLAKLESLQAQGFARAEEVDRARTDVSLGQADVLSVTEEMQLRKLELARARVQLERRSIRSKLSGVVTKLHKEVGEFVAANDPVIMTIVQLDPLRVSFSVPRNQAMQLKEQLVVTVRFVASRQEATARVEYISPLTDAESTTVTVRLTIANPEGRFRAGDRCEMDLPAAATELAESPPLPGPKRQTPAPKRRDGQGGSSKATK